ncbi:MAG: hypothetical protein CMJ54_10480 [Planctomycetaceae bacterium]|nr:hypothetical protein [Planctomycetaceae bacterium]
MDYIVAIDRGACPPQSLENFFHTLSKKKPDVLVGVSDYDRLAGIMAIRPSVLQLIPEVGYCDFKEQTLNKLASVGGSILALAIIPKSIRIGSLSGWIEAVSYHQINGEDSHRERRHIERGSCCIDDSADIGNAVVLDSIVMPDTVIGDRAVIARSAICPGSIVAPGARIIDSIVSDRVISINSRQEYSGRLP